MEAVSRTVLVMLLLLLSSITYGKPLDLVQTLVEAHRELQAQEPPQPGYLQRANFQPKDLAGMDTYIHFLRSSADVAIATALLMPPIKYLNDRVVEGVAEHIAQSIPKTQS